ncbi:FAD-dependent oxidoreductase [Fodinicola feengrottensis]|uniref:FAD-dependent oxidoreductase n=1 Tax=Fodinicola feengrottensis TaxID=435914 RepID=UPI0028BF3E8F|nr:FAD-dependent oxidoreductase [Fodinicola feengrottensis]
MTTGVVVVGAGVGGLAVAARLAAGGHHVTVCERAAEVGGKLGLIQVSTSDGEYRFDTGPSLLTFPQVLADLFDETGEPVTSALGLRRLDPIADYRFADGTRLAMRAVPTSTRETRPSTTLSAPARPDSGMPFSAVPRTSGRPAVDLSWSPLSTVHWISYDRPRISGM